MKRVALLVLLSCNIFAEGKLDCQGIELCFQTHNKSQNSFTEPLKYEQPKGSATKLLQDVLNTLGFDVLKVDQNHIKASKKSSFLKVITRIEFDLTQEPLIHFVAISDSPKLDWGGTKELIEKMKFRFYQNNM